MSGTFFGLVWFPRKRKEKKMIAGTIIFFIFFYSLSHFPYHYYYHIFFSLAIFSINDNYFMVTTNFFSGRSYRSIFDPWMAIKIHSCVRVYSSFSFSIPFWWWWWSSSYRPKQQHTVNIHLIWFFCCSFFLGSTFGGHQISLIIKPNTEKKNNENKPTRKERERDKKKFHW